jgi:ribosome-binding protein aMBF1 (putative translation factor)
VGVLTDDLWEGPVHGQLGVLADDGERAQCHICGDYFGNLGGHVSQVHGVSPDEYKERFELKASTGLLGPALKDLRRRQAADRIETTGFERFQRAAKRAQAAISPEERSGWSRGRRARLEERLDPARRAANEANLTKANEVLRERRRAGLHREVGFGDRDPKEISALGRARIAELRADPAWREAFARKVSEARGGRLQVTCIVCGKTFPEPWSKKTRKTCGAECRRELSRQTAATRREKVRVSPLGPAVQRARRAAGLSQEQLAAKAAISASYVSLIERGRHRPAQEIVARLEAALDVELAGLIDEGEEGKPRRRPKTRTAA